MTRQNKLAAIAAFIVGVITTVVFISSVAVEAVAGAPLTTPLGTGFRFEGIINPASLETKTCDLRFGLFDAEVEGRQIGNTQEILKAYTGRGGPYVVELNGGNEFGNDAFVGEARWVEVETRCRISTERCSALDPRCRKVVATPTTSYVRQPSRQKLLPAPYALFGKGGFRNLGPPARLLTTVELTKVKAGKRDIHVVRDEPVVAMDIIKITTDDGVYLLDLCTGTLYNILGEVVYQYPGDWSSESCDL
jgi:hypothetical protein